jgi:hypothetical protein
VLKESSDEIIKLNQDQLYEQGVINVTNPAKREYYAESTKRQKRRTAKFPKTDFITLKWRGVFHETFQVFISRDTIDIRSPHIIWGLYLQENERFTNALGLTNDSIELLRDNLRDKFITAFRNEL